MCGIAGVLRLDGLPAAANLVARMAATLRHRGPDSDGVWTDGPIGLGHRRLAIIDLSPTGHQPMGNETGNVLITYNGELYNYQTLRLELEGAGHRFHSRSDTEVIVHAYEEWGADCLRRFNGHFAFAIWDGPNRRLFLARDRFGTKPLYYYHDGAKFLFASEIKAILAYPGVRSAICYPALDEYFTFQNILTDRTLFDGVKLLPAGCYMTLDLADGRSHQQPYWDYRFSEEPLNMSETEAAEELHRLLSQAVTRQLMSDVPLGCYLSGGMDSGSITALARQQIGRLTTFTCGFDLSSASGMELGFDERAKAEAMSNLFKTEHYEMVLHAGDMEHVMPELVWHIEDLRVGQCYPNYYVARLAGKFVKVVLTGVGGDELFAGYPWRYYRSLNGNGKGDFYRRYYDFWQRLTPDADKPRLFQESVCRQMKDHSAFEVFKRVIAPTGMPVRTNGDCVNACLYFELKTFLHGLLLIEDRTSMAHGLESRAPFLDNDLVDFALRLPVGLKLRNLDHPGPRLNENEPGKRLRFDSATNDGKTVLREAMSRVIPRAVTERIKQGFSAPDASWFRGESIDYVNRLLRDRKARIYDLLQPAYVHDMLDSHCSGHENHRLFIWSLLCLELWLQKFMG